MKKLIYAGLVTVTFIVVFNTSLTIKDSRFSSIELNNIETLSYAESTNDICCGIGSVDCPKNKTKVIIVYNE